MTEVLSFNNINLNDDSLSFSKPEKVRNIYYSKILNNDKPLFIQTNKLEILSNTKELNDKDPSIEFKISNHNLDFYDFLNKLDNKLIQKTFQNSKDWFSKEIPLETIDDMYKRLLKPIQKNNMPNIRFKLPQVNNKILTKIYNQNKKFLDIKEVNNNIDAILILHIRGIKFMKQHYICDVYISQMKIYEVNNNYIISEDCLINNDNNESDEDIIDEENYNKKLEEEKIKLEEEKLKQEEEEKLKQEEKTKLKEEKEKLEKENQVLEKNILELQKKLHDNIENINNINLKLNK